MTTAEATISMVNRLSDAEQLDVQKYIRRIFARREKKTAAELKPISKEEFLVMIDRSIEQGNRGEVYSWEDVRRDTRERYGI